MFSIEFLVQNGVNTYKLILDKQSSVIEMLVNYSLSFCNVHFGKFLVVATSE